MFAILCLLIVGCSTKPKDTGKIHLRFSILGAKQEADLANALARGFEAKHPNIKIDVEPVAGMGYDIKLIMQSASGTVPDVLFLADSLVPTFTKYNVVRDLNEFIKDDPEFPIDDIYPQMLATGMDKQGRIFQLPRELGVVVMFYNRTLFRKAGLPDPPPDWTNEDFLRMARKLTIYEDGTNADPPQPPLGKGGLLRHSPPYQGGVGGGRGEGRHGRVTQYGFTASYNWCGVYAPWVASEGGRVVTQDGKWAAFSSPESVKALKDLIELVTVEKVALPPNRSLTIPGVDPFAAGKIAMTPQIFPQVPLFRATMKDFDWDVQVMPRGSVRHVTNMGAAGYGMSTNTKHPKEAWEFLKYIVSREGQTILARSGSGIPCLKSMANDPSWRIPPKSAIRNPQSALNYDAFIDSVEIGMGWDDFLILTRPEVQDAVNQAFEKSFLGKSSVESAFKEADTKINKVLGETKD